MAIRPVWAEIDVAAITHNARVLADLVAPAELCAVVKAYAYGHGPVRTAEAALAGGATWLAVALVEEGQALRSAGIDDPVLVLSEPRPGAMAEVVAADLRPAIYTRQGVDSAAKAVADFGRSTPLPVHVKVDTGMHRVGAAPAKAIELALDVASRSELRLEGVWTHFAVADEPARNDYTAAQLETLRQVVDALAAEGVRPDVVHACNSAGALGHPSARLDLVRCGIALYGIAPSKDLAAEAARLRPALSLRAQVSYVKKLAAGEGVSYGLRWTAERDTVIATVPIGYADGVPRRYGPSGGEVLIGGRRCPITGIVTMDQLMVDCGPEANVHVGDEVVLIGRQGDEAITAWDWADLLDTIAYEVVCGLSARVPRAFR